MSGSVWVHAADLWQHLYACCLHRPKAASLRGAAGAAEAAPKVQERLDPSMAAKKTKQERTVRLK